MWRRPAGVVLALVTSAGGATPLPGQELPTTVIAKRATPATVTILTLDASGDTLGQGSGFIVRGDGVIVTNYHVMRGATAAVVRLPSGERFDRVQVLDADEGRDLAILKVPGFGMPALSPADDHPVVGQDIVVIGAPRGYESTVSEGIVSAVRLMDGQQWVQITAPISPGSSGGPILDRSGRVLAVATAYREDGQALGFAVPIRYAMGLVGESSRPRAVGEVFARRAGALDRSGDLRPIVLPEPAENASKEWLVDSYLVRGRTHLLELDGDHLQGDWRGVLLVAAEGTGLLYRSYVADDGSLMDPDVYFITRGFATERGRVLIAISRLSQFEGYFTYDGGLALTSDVTHERARLVDSAVATPTEIALAKPYGLYRITWRSRYVPAGASSPGQETLEWGGRAAVVTTGDSVWVDLVARNHRGGSTVFRSSGRMNDGRFRLRTYDGSSLEGSMDSGILRAEFIDWRESGSRFIGEIRGSRE